MKHQEKSKQLPSLRHIVSSLKGTKSQDYTFTTMFFIIFSVFIFFAIRPALGTAISLSKQEADLRIIDGKYEQLIDQIVQIQTTLEQVRDRLYLVDQALPEQPNLNVIMQDIQNSAINNNVNILKIDIRKVNLVESERDAFRSMTVTVELSTTFDDYIAFEKELLGQRRLKKIKKLDMVKLNADASSSAGLQIKAEIDGYYL